MSGILGDPVLEIPAMSTAPKLTSNASPQIQERLPKSGPGPTPLVAIVGPTASGKSSLGAWLARKYGGEVLACDSTQVYRCFYGGRISCPGRRGSRRLAPSLAAPDSNCRDRALPACASGRTGGCPRTLRGIARTPGGGRGQAQPSVSASRLAASGPRS